MLQFKRWRLDILAARGGRDRYVICLLCKTMSAMMFCPYLDKIRQEKNEKCKPIRYQSLLLCRLKLAVPLMLHDKSSNIWVSWRYSRSLVVNGNFCCARVTHTQVRFSTRRTLHGIPPSHPQSHPRDLLQYFILLPWTGPRHQRDSGCRTFPSWELGVWWNHFSFPLQISMSASPTRAGTEPPASMASTPSPACACPATLGLSVSKVRGVP